MFVDCSRFNEFAKQMIGESGRAAQTRAMLFDISFLMLCHVTQMYGTQVRTDACMHAHHTHICLAILVMFKQAVSYVTQSESCMDRFLAKTTGEQRKN